MDRKDIGCFVVDRDLQQAFSNSWKSGAGLSQALGCLPFFFVEEAKQQSNRTGPFLTESPRPFFGGLESPLHRRRALLVHRLPSEPACFPFNLAYAGMTTKTA